MFIYRASQVTKHVTGRPYVTTGYLKQKERLEKHKDQGDYTAVGALIKMILYLSFYTIL